MGIKPATESFKNWAKKSGFPFENDVLREILGAAGPGAIFTQEIEFVAETPEGSKNIRSVDLRVEFFLKCQIDRESIDPDQGLRIIFIVDAKWHQPGEAYWFVPSTSGRPPIGLGSLIPIEKENIVGRKTISRQVLRDLIRNALSHIPKAGRGAKASENEERRQSLAAAVGQVLECMRHEAMAESNTLGRIKDNKYYCVNGLIFVPVVVTNAPMYMLKNGVKTNEIDLAKDVSEVCTEEKIIACEFPRDFHLNSQFQKLIFHASNIIPTTMAGVRWKVEELSRPHCFIIHDSAIKDFINSLLAELSKLSNSKLILPPPI